MKRLLAYLFIVLGLGLTLSVSANHSWNEGHFCIKKKGDDGKWPFYANVWGGYDECPSGMKEVSKKKFETFKKIIDKKYVPNSIAATVPKKNLNNKKKTNLECNDKDWNGNDITWRSCKNNSKIKMSKAEPSQTQKVLLNNIALNINFCIDSKKRLTDKIFPTLKKCSSFDRFGGEISHESSNYESFLKQKTKIDQSESKWKSKKGEFITGNKNFICFNDTQKKVVRRTRNCNEMNLIQVNYDGKKFYLDDSQETQIAKAEPSQTQKVAVNNDERRKENTPILDIIDWHNLPYRAFLISNPNKHVAYTNTVLFLKNGKCKTGFDLRSIFKNYNYEGSWETKCKWRYKYDGTSESIVNKDILEIELQPGGLYIIKKKLESNLEGVKKFKPIAIHIAKYLTMEGGKNIWDPDNKVVEKKKQTIVELSEIDKSFIINQAKILKTDNFLKLIKQETQIAKTEPGQTQKVVETVSLKLNKNEVDAIFSSVNSCWSIPLGLPYNQDLSVKIKVKFDPSGNAIRTEIIDFAKINKKGNAYLKVLAESALRAIKLCSPIRAPKDKYDLWKEVVFNFDAKDVLNGTESKDTKIAKNNLLKKYTETQIAKEEPTVTPKKKVKVTKVEEPKQEEFKPENKDIDNDAPVIEIAQNITVDSQTYTLKGTVKDKSRFQLTIDDRPIKVAKNGEFEFEGFAIDSKEQLKIVAIDRWKNKSEKVINVEVKIKQVADLRSYEKPNPSKIKVKKDNNKIGIIIGIEKYQNLNNIDAPYANRDAKAFKAYANIALGIPNNNLKVLIDEDATRGELLKSLKIWLPQITRGKGKDIYIFFAGHGLASDNGEDLHILPHNGDPILLEDTALSRIEMFDLINKVNPKSVTMFFDTCYSGQTRSEQMLIAGLRPVRIVADEQDTPNNFTIFTASNYDQTSGSINEAEHGIFSYYLMKGLEGKADENSDKKITNGELISYLKNNVTQEAFSQNRSQEPMLSGDPDKVLISYR